ncbi:LysR family transcriptional regulator [Paenibacillus sp. HB172176]|uniref:LysR family transcriptional regulator n=1 Tax=Paenibacillus sp. HB172176 TaxID=2493690 RepID=UPI001438F986|nr:LysR family transcriptional regulator [Paenibacillus sp. HB172176]
MESDINLEWYRVFYWIAKTGSLTGAAAQLSITQPAVSHTIKQLEDSIGGALFARTSRGVQLTSEGEVLLQYIEQAFYHIEKGEKAIAELHQLTSGEIHIGASDTLSKYYLMPFLEQFRVSCPGIRMHMTNRTTPEIMELLKAGKIDFGIVSLPTEDKQVYFRKSAVIQDCLVGGAAYEHLTQAGESVSLEAISKHPLLLLEAGGSTRTYIEKYAYSQGVQLRPEFELGSIELLVDFAKKNFGLAFVIREFIEEELAAGQLVEIPLDPPLPERHIGIATMKGMPLSSAAKAFLNLLPAL